MTSETPTPFLVLLVATTVLAGDLASSRTEQRDRHEQFHDRNYLSVKLDSRPLS